VLGLHSQLDRVFLLSLCRRFSPILFLARVIFVYSLFSCCTSCKIIFTSPHPIKKILLTKSDNLVEKFSQRFENTELAKTQTGSLLVTQHIFLHSINESINYKEHHNNHHNINIPHNFEDIHKHNFIHDKQITGDIVIYTTYTRYIAPNSSYKYHDTQVQNNHTTS